MTPSFFNPQWLFKTIKFKPCLALVQHTQPVQSLRNLPFPSLHLSNIPCAPNILFCLLFTEPFLLFSIVCLCTRCFSFSDCRCSALLVESGPSFRTHLRAPSCWEPFPDTPVSVKDTCRASQMIYHTAL